MTDTTPTPADVAAKAAEAAAERADEAAPAPQAEAPENGRENGREDLVAALRREAAGRRQRVRDLEAALDEREAEIDRLRSALGARDEEEFAKTSRLARPDIALALAEKTVSDFVGDDGRLDVERVRAFGQEALDSGFEARRECEHCGSTPPIGFFLPEDKRGDEHRPLRGGSAAARVAEGLLYGL